MFALMHSEFLCACVLASIPRVRFSSVALFVRGLSAVVVRAGCALVARLMRADPRTPELLGNWKVCWPFGDPGLFTFTEIIGKPSIWSMRG